MGIIQNESIQTSDFIKKYLFFKWVLKENRYKILLGYDIIYSKNNVLETNITGQSHSVGIDQVQKIQWALEKY